METEAVDDASAPVGGPNGGMTFDTLKAKLEETFDALKSVWEREGLAEAEQNSQIASLFSAVHEVVDQKRADEEEIMHNYISEIARLRQEVEEARGCMGQDAAVNDLEDCAEGLIPQMNRLSEVHDSVCGERDRRREKLDGLHARLSDLCSSIGQSMPEGMEEVGPTLSEERIAAFDAAVSTAQHRKQERVNAMNKVMEQIAESLEELEAEPAEGVERSAVEGGTGLGFTTEDLERLTACAKVLEERKEERLAEMQCRVDEADTLWSRLGTAAEDQQRLLALKTSPGASAAERADAELAALREQLQARLGDLVAALRERVGGLWEELNMTEAKGREEFPAFALGAGEFSDAVLTEHEQYVEMLEDRARRLRPILKNIARREDLVAERVEYDKLVQDSSRLLSRRSGRAILEEEKMMRRVTKELPKLTERLRHAVQTWEEENGELCYKGERYLDHLERQEGEYEAQKARVKAAKDGKKHPEEGQRAPTHQQRPCTAAAGARGFASPQTRKRAAGKPPTPGTKQSATALAAKARAGKARAAGGAATVGSGSRQAAASAVPARANTVHGTRPAAAAAAASASPRTVGKGFGSSRSGAATAALRRAAGARSKARATARGGTGIPQPGATRKRAAPQTESCSEREDAESPSKRQAKQGQAPESAESSRVPLSPRNSTSSVRSTASRKTPGKGGGRTKASPALSALAKIARASTPRRRRVAGSPAEENA